ncbi:MAG TPA: EpsI family protein [Candidatus Acidoferrales bacterium]|nr:EpsI family protein [Candidatus Acidoferrales bacterium]
MTLGAITWKRLLPVLILIVATAALLQAHERPEIVPPHKELSAFPAQISSWSGTPLSLSADDLAVLGPGEFLLRDYQESANEPSVNLYIAYFPSQRTGDTIHSPKNCLPGAGWVPDQSARMALKTGNGSILVNRYIVSKGLTRALVLYWYQAHGRVTPSEYWAKIFLVADAIRLNRTDGALVRVVSEIPPGTSDHATQTRALNFTHQILPLLDSYIPR